MNKINVKKFYNMLIAASNSLNDNKEYLNSLNVFPVPDGDTGTNMSATFSEAVKSITLHEDSTIESIASSLSRGALMGARGNSGVILSQILRGLSRGLSSVDEIDVPSLVKSLNLASESAYGAVMKPKEGTILTVIKAASDSATLNSTKANILDFLDCVLVDTKNMLNQTREMLPENKSANTVDAGGAGLVIIMQSFVDVLHGKVDITQFNFNTTDVQFDFVDIHPNAEDIEFQYCTEFIIKAGVKEDELKDRLCSLGDSLVVISIDNITKVHIHTNSPGTAFNIAMEYGDLTKMKVDNMAEQAESNVNITKKNTAPKIDQAIIAVASGSGIEEMFMDIGVTHVISGGQSMNPSVEDIVKAIESVNAKNVVILPNNKNIILSAEQASNIVDCNVFVVKTKSIPQGITAAISFDSNVSFDDNCSAMSDAITSVVSCQITKAVKDSTMNDLSIKEGDILGIIEDKIEFNASDYTSILLKIFNKCITEDISIASVIVGAEIENSYVTEVQSILEEIYSDIDICFSIGNQEVYPFIIAFE